MEALHFDAQRHGQLAVDSDLLAQAHYLGLSPTEAANDGLTRAASEARARMNIGQREDERKAITIRLDARVLAYFRENAVDARDSESEINRVLRDYVLHQVNGRRRAPPTDLPQ